MPRFKAYSSAEIKNRILGTVDMAIMQIQKRVRFKTATPADYEQLKLLSGILTLVEEKVASTPLNRKEIGTSSLKPEDIEKMLGK
jgi:hypothetical protein